MNRLDVLRQHVAILAQLRKGKPCMDSLLLTYGRVFEGAPCPEQYAGHPMKMCFKNCLMLMASSPELIYCEGYAMPEGIDFPIHHAWLLDEEGNVIDPTWTDPEGALYVGIPFDANYLFELAQRTGYANVFDNMQNASILKADPEEYLHPDFWPSSEPDAGAKGQLVL